MMINQAMAGPQVSQVVVGEAVGTFLYWKQSLRFWWHSNGWAASFPLLQGKLTDRPKKPEPKPQETQEARNRRIQKIKVTPEEVTLQVGEAVQFVATAYDSNGSSVGGVKFNWSGEETEKKRRLSIVESLSATLDGISDVSLPGSPGKAKTVTAAHNLNSAAVSRKGQFLSPEPGVYQVKAEVAGHQAQVNIKVTGTKRNLKETKLDVIPASTRDLPAEKKGEKIGAASPDKKGAGLSGGITSSVQPALPGMRTRFNKGLALKGQTTSFAPSGVSLPAASGSVALVQSGGDPYGWNNNNYTTADDSGKERGNMPGREADTAVGAGNYKLSVPLVGMDGRNIDVSLALVYNSRLWHKANNEITFNIDDDSPAPGWNIGFGRIVAMGTNRGYMLIDADGTRHGYAIRPSPMSWQTSYGQHINSHTIDGTFIDYVVEGRPASQGGAPLSAYARLSNGTYIAYGAPGNNAIYPTYIEDANGNFVTISYVGNQGPRIQQITDTLGRSIDFHYEGNLLTAVTAPAFNGGTPRTLVRLQYQPLTLSYNYSSNPAPKVRQGTVSVVKAIYIPATGTGYWFGEPGSYHPYGMITRVLEHRGMGFDNAPLNSQGQISPGQMSHETIYSYGSPSTAEPTFTEMKERWAGMDSNAPYLSEGWAKTTYQVVEEFNSLRRRTTITRPDGTKSVQYAWINFNSFDDGMVFFDKVCAPDQSCEYEDYGLRASSVTWAQGEYLSPRPSALFVYDVTHEAGNRYKLTTFDYGPYNQATKVEEWGYDGQKRRITTTEYENSPNYINRHIFNLVKNTQTRDANNNVLYRTEYTYDGGTLANLLTPGVTHHNATHDPYDPGYPDYDMVCNEYGYCEWIPVWRYTYDPATNYRGLITMVKSFADAAARTGEVVETRGYDKTGNLITSTTSCCEQTTFTYTVDTQFAYPQERRWGSATDAANQNLTSTVYNFNTGLITSSTDADGRTAITEYYAAPDYPETLRPRVEWSSTNASVQFVYDDPGMVIYDRIWESNEAFAGGSDRYLDGYGRAHGEVFYTVNGAGQQVVDVVQTEFDALGRLWKKTRPFRNGVDTPQWHLNEYDHLDRITKTIAPDNSTTEFKYDADAPKPSSADPNRRGNRALSIDQWGRERWGITDEDGRLVEVVEPNPAPDANGNGRVASAGNTVTKYTYDPLGRVTRIDQGDQERKFKYDSLGRLTHQKLAERDAPLNDSGQSGSSWSDVYTYDNRSNLTQHIDARQVKTFFSYDDDPLNRIQSVSYDKSESPYAASIPDAAPVYYEYMTADDKTRLRKRTDGMGSEEFDYDVEGRIKQQNRIFSGASGTPLVTNFLYDSLNRVKEVTYPAQYGFIGTPRKTLVNSYDPAGRLKGLTYNGQSIASQIVYNPESQPLSLKIGSNASEQLSETYEYDAQRGFLTRQKVLRANSATSVLLDLSYNYSRPNLGGRTGQVTQIINNLDATGSKNRSYEYDTLGRLKTVKGGSSSAPWWTQTYQYDRYGNRTQVTKTGNVPLDAVNPAGTSSSFTLNFEDGSNKVLTNRITTSGYTYDAAGNMTRGQAADGSWQNYKYDAAGRMVEVRADNAPFALASYYYGASNHRLKSVEYNGSTNVATWYAWSGDEVLAQYDITYGTPLWSKSSVYLGNRLIATDSNNAGLQFHHPDRLGTRLVTNSSNSTVSGEQVHMPFGAEFGAESSGIATTRRFTSYERSNITKQDYAINRTYNLGLGRFTQVDPIAMGASDLGDPQSLNLYAYCGNDPVNFTDPSGLFFKKLFKWLFRIITIVLAVVFVVAGVLIAISVLTGASWAGSGFLAIMGTLAKLGIVKGVGVTAYLAEGGISIGVTGKVLAAVAAIGAVAQATSKQNQSKKPKEKKKPCAERILDAVDAIKKADDALKRRNNGEGKYHRNSSTVVHGKNLGKGNHCNLYVHDVLHKAGVSHPHFENGHPINAATWGNPKRKIAGFEIVQDRSRKAGDVIGQTSSTGGDNSAHVAIAASGNTSTSSTTRQSGNIDEYDFGSYQSQVQYPAPVPSSSSQVVVRRCKD